VTPSTLFCTASTTKAFTAAAVSLLIDSSPLYKNITWSTPLRHLIGEDFVLADNHSTHHVTLEDALCHRTGLPGFDFMYLNTSRTLQNIVQNLRFLPLTAELRTKFQYCNLMFSTVSHAIEILTGEWLGDFFARRIWQPLGMKTTYFSLADAQKSAQHLARGYMFNKRTGEYEPQAYEDVPAIAGAGNIISNVLDYAKWLRMMFTQAGPVSAAAHEALTTPHFIVGPPIRPYASTWLYGLGWDVTTYHGEKVVWHQGGFIGFGTYVLFLPERKWGVAAFGNSGETSNLAEEELVWHLIDELLGIPKTQRAATERESMDHRETMAAGSERVLLV